MKMTGSWHVYREGERWRKGAHLARVVVGADSGWLGVCFQAPVVETHHRALGDPLPLAALGPALTTLDPDIDAAVARAERAAPGNELGDALLDQRISSGLGHVYKSADCFLNGIDPFTPLADVAPDVLHRILGP